MEIPSDRIDNTLILKPGGRVDGQNALEFQSAIDSAIDATNDSVILELSELSYISSAGLRVILLLAKTLRSRNVQFSMCSISDTVKDVFEISGIRQNYSYTRHSRRRTRFDQITLANFRWARQCVSSVNTCHDSFGQSCY